MTEEEMKELEKSRQAINREQWLDLMRGCAIYHKKKAEETAPVILGEQASEEHIMHKVWSLSCLLYTSPSPRDRQKSRMPSSA